MGEATFSEPVFVRTRGEDGRSQLLEIRTAREGVRAIHRDGFGGFHIESLAWQNASEKLIKAALDPTPEKTEEARLALVTLARETKAPLDG